ncbi:hypothetical protein BDV98DRAFT_550413 [Pterulicium gracile]|uniref:G-protein coupled receptors family 1 profile domain-containing protein n=1 Tax=Pterulicium gracile TaxID=1884261 RepID=A0A5C3QFY8_9AGAR|nr:hypothetical protein BDV98DRAFT_550413 [Pterula gracilis]
MFRWVDRQRFTAVLSQLTYAMMGMVIWDLACTWDFELSLIRRKRTFRWPLVPIFFGCRYCILLALIGLVVADQVSSEINCAALYTFNSFSGNMAILCASTSLMLRTLAIWERRMVVMIPLGIACLVHWILMFFGMFVVKAAWDVESSTCVVVASDPIFLRVTLFYTMVWDLVILLMTIWAWRRTNASKSGLWQLLFRDGLVFFLVSFATNTVPAVLNILNLNDVMNVIATVPAATISSLAACRCVMRLSSYSNSDVYIHSVANYSPGAGAGGPNITFNRPSTTVLHHHHRVGAGGLGTLNMGTSTQGPEVLVTTEQITMAEFSARRGPKGSDDIERGMDRDSMSRKDSSSMEV